MVRSLLCGIAAVTVFMAGCAAETPKKAESKPAPAAKPAEKPAEKKS